MSVDLERYAAEFDRCAPWIESALPYANGCFDLCDIRNAVLAGKMQLWPGRRSAAITEISDYPQKRACTIVFAGGDLAELRDLIQPQVRAHAKSSGCGLFIVHGRAGWSRALGVGRVSHTVSVEDI